jgi:hypothetical protein
MSMSDFLKTWSENITKFSISYCKTAAKFSLDAAEELNLNNCKGPFSIATSKLKKASFNFSEVSLIALNPLLDEISIENCTIQDISHLQSKRVKVSDTTISDLPNLELGSAESIECSSSTLRTHISNQVVDVAFSKNSSRTKKPNSSF